MSVLKVLAVLGRVPPQAWDWIVPHGPAIRSVHHRVSVAETAGINPQPEPPRIAFLRGSAEVAHQVTRMAVSSGVRGEPVASWLGELIDDWCGTGWPRKFPFPTPPDPDPEPDWRGIDRAAGLAVAAVVLASTAVRLEDGEVAAALSDGAERLAAAAGEMKGF